MKKNIHVWIEGTIVAALALVLSLIPIQIGSSFTISLGQIPLTLFALRRGWKAGIISGFLWGLLHFPTGQVYYLSVVQVLIEYPLAFTFAGFAGLASANVQKNIRADNSSGTTTWLAVGALSGVFARFFWHFVAGVVFWGSYAMWGMSPWIFSLVMNGASGLATGVVTFLALLAVKRIAPKLFLPVDKRRQETVEHGK